MQIQGIRAIPANKDVIEGISTVATLFKTRDLLAVENQVKVFKNEIYNYVWAKGKDEPVKSNDDVLDSVRYGIYSEIKMTGTTIDRSKYGI